MDRYDIRVNVWGDVSGPQYEWETVKAEDGDFVLYADAQATVEALQAAANYYKQPSKNGGVYSVSGGHIGNLMDWCKDNLAHCKFSGPDEDNLDLDLVQTAQQIPQLKTELSQLQALVRALPVAERKVRVKAEGIFRARLAAKMVGVGDEMALSGTPELIKLIADLLKYRATLDATTPAIYKRIVDDGFGSSMEMCGRKDCGLQVVRPGKFQCTQPDCYDNSKGGDGE